MACEYLAPDITHRGQKKKNNRQLQRKHFKVNKYKVNTD